MPPMTKKITKIEVDQTNVPLQPEIEMKKDVQEEDKAGEPSDLKLMNAEEATKIAVEFLKSLGIKKTLPNRASNEGSRSYVELDLGGKKAAVVVDGRTKEILEYEIEKAEKIRSEGGRPISLKLLFILMGFQFMLTILFSFIKPYIPFLP